MFKDIEDLRLQIKKFGLDRFEDKLLRLAKPAIQIHRTRTDDVAIPVGTSKLGGNPDLPIGFKWQYLGEKPLTFIVQFKLSEIAPQDISQALPSSGMLYYFYEADEVPYGTYEHRDSWQVVYLEDENTPLVRTPHPTYQGRWGLIDALPSHTVSFSSKLSLPRIFYNERFEYELDFNKPYEQDSEYEISEHKAYWKFCDSAYPEPYHHLLGYPIQIQYHIEWDVVTLSQRIKLQKKPESNQYFYSDEQISHIRSEMSKWQFLFQIDSDDSLKVMWGDVGTLYICIPKASLAARQFEDCWKIMQCS